MKETIKNIIRVICIVCLFISIFIMKDDDKAAFVVAITNLSCFFVIGDMFFSVASNNMRNAEFIEKYHNRRMAELDELKSGVNKLKQKYGISSYGVSEKEQYQKTYDSIVETICKIESDIEDFNNRVPKYKKRYSIWKNVGIFICTTGVVSCVLMFCCREFSTLMFSITDYATIVGFMMIFVIQILNSKYIKEAKEDESEAEKGDELIRQIRGEIMKRL